MLSKITVVILLLALATGGVFLADHEIDSAFAQRLAYATELHERAKADLAENHATLLADSVVPSKENARRRRDEWVRVYGGAAEFAARNSEFNLVEMLEQLALACAPGDTRSTVKVEHFTEFELTLDFKNPPPREALGGITACVLARAAAYLHSIRFTQNDSLYAVLTPEALYSVPNWAAISPDQAAALVSFVGDATPASRTAATDSGLPTLLGGGARREVSEQEMDPAYSAYMTLKRQHAEAVDRYAKMLFEARALQQYPTAEMLQAKLDQIQVEWANIQPSQDFLRDPVPELERQFKESRKLPLYIKIVLRGERELVAALKPKQEAKFSAIQAHQASTTGFLKAMLGRWGQWSTRGDRVQFSSRETLQDFQTWLDRVNATAAQYNAAMAL